MEKKCEKCNDIYYKDYHRSLKSWGKSKYCSRECKHLSQKVIRNSFIKKCLVCGKDMLVNPSQIADGRGKHCSVKCSALGKTGKERPDMRGNNFCEGKIPWNKGLKGFLSREKHYKWKGGMSDRLRSIEWLNIRQLILERDFFKCQDCGKNHHEVRLNIHHLVPYKISKDNSLNNLITLCVSCHVTRHNLNIKKGALVV